MTASRDNRRLVLTGVLIGLIPAFALTHTIVERYKQERRQLATEWSVRGGRDLRARPAVAVADFETALSYSPDDTDDRFNLSQALVESKRLPEARAQLLTLWTEAPGDGRVNLELGRIAAATNDDTDAIRYYHAAIDGGWESGASAARRMARLELARFLLRRGQNIRAQAELIAMIDDLPSDPESITDVGALLADAGADARAMGLFQRALTLAPAYPRAARLAGGVAFRAGDYRLAYGYLSEAAKRESLDPSSQDALDVTTQVLALDPAAARLTTRARATRTLACVGIAQRRIAACTASTASSRSGGEPFAALNEGMESLGKLTDGDLLRDPDLIDSTMATVFQVEALPSNLCGPPTLDDRALQLLSGQRRAATR